MGTVLSAAAPWPLVTIATAVVIAVLLWGLFRRGSISDRARADDDQSPGASTDGH